MNEVKQVNDILDYSIAQGISDIHCETTKDAIVIRMRKDGLLFTYARYAKVSRLLMRLKVQAQLDVAMQKLQDGRFHYQGIDVRVSVVPTYWGEKIVLRLLLPARRNIYSLGLPESIIERLKGILQKQAGLILITGPTGSGKTTTLYSLLEMLPAENKNIITLEDPVEYIVPGITQVPILPLSSYAAVLRAVLRQDPDIIFIGEIRDEETAAIGLRAAMTGHLVFATLHTQNTKTAWKRLIDLGVPEYLLEDTIQCVLAQRLFRLNGQGRSALFEYYEKDFCYTFEEAKKAVLAKNITNKTELMWITC